MRVGPEAAPNCRVYAYLWGTDYDAAGRRLEQPGLPAGAGDEQRRLRGLGHAGRWSTVPAWPAAAAYDRVRFGEGGGAYLFALQERAAKGYWFVSALYALPGNADMEEPVYLAEADGANGGAGRLRDAAAPGLRPPRLAGRRGRRSGRRRRRTPRVDLAVRTYTPISYRYEAGASGGGVLQLRLARTQSAAGAIETFGAVYPPEVYVGDMLWLDRTLSVGRRAAARRRSSSAWRPCATAAATSRCWRCDALGVLAHMRPRRRQGAGRRTTGCAWPTSRRCATGPA